MLPLLRLYLQLLNEALRGTRNATLCLNRNLLLLIPSSSLLDATVHVYILTRHRRNIETSILSILLEHLPQWFECGMDLESFEEVGLVVRPALAIIGEGLAA